MGCGASSSPPLPTPYYTQPVAAGLQSAGVLEENAAAKGQHPPAAQQPPAVPRVSAAAASGGTKGWSPHEYIQLLHSGQQPTSRGSGSGGDGGDCSTTGPPSSSSSAPPQLFGRICVGQVPKDFQWLGGVPPSAHNFVFAIGSGGLAQFVGKGPLQILLMAGFSPMFIYRSVLAGCCFNLVVWNPSDASNDIRGAATWDSIAAMLREDHRELWDNVISGHWFDVCTVAFSKHERDYNSGKEPNAFRKADQHGGWQHQHQCHPQHQTQQRNTHLMTATKLQQLGVKARPSDVRAFICHEYDVGPDFMGGGASAAQSKPKHSPGGIKPVAQYIVRNIKSVGLACLPLGIEIDKVVINVVDALRQLHTRLEHGTPHESSGESSGRLQQRERAQLRRARSSFVIPEGQKSNGSRQRVRSMQCKLDTYTSSTISKLRANHHWRTISNWSTMQSIASQVSSTCNQGRSLSPDEYLERFQSGRSLNDDENLNGLFGRIVSGRSPENFAWLSGYAPTSIEEGGLGHCMFVTGPEGLQRMLNIAAATKRQPQQQQQQQQQQQSQERQMQRQPSWDQGADGEQGDAREEMGTSSLVMTILLEIGYEPLAIYEKFAAGYSFELVVFHITKHAFRQRHRRIMKGTQAEAAPSTTASARSKAQKWRRYSTNEIDTDLTQSWVVTGQPLRADWEGLRSMIEVCFPEVAGVVNEHLSTLKTASFDQLQQEYGPSWYMARHEVMHTSVETVCKYQSCMVSK